MKKLDLPLIANKSVCFTFFLLVFCSATAESAINCVSGQCENKVVNLSIIDTLTGSENAIGYQKNSQGVSIPSFSFYLTEGGALSEWFVYPGKSVPGTPTTQSWNTDWSFIPVDDYVSIAASFTNSCQGTVYAPFKIDTLYPGPCNRISYSPDALIGWRTKEFAVRLKITKKIIGGSYSKNMLVAEYGLCSGNCNYKQYTIARVYVSINITAPETCELNAGQVINIDFGNVSSGAFKTAGAIAQGVQPKSRDISVKCDNIAGNAQLTLRLQADKTNGNIVVSDENNDVGFRVTNNGGTPLIPNNLSSVIPFTLDSNARQNVTIQAYPVSVTGNKPTEGPVTSRAYLRVDFP
ncbi:fimbrial protein [Serratia marcescens]|uniref:fimbrial protein n=1 Tax=Serratia marcescens TaxID=615 RepID=UPI001F46E92F|nr:fimbrial protein [Serratia marcescens]UIM56018.1 fimbrial protein [Serratia marcescens]